MIARALNLVSMLLPCREIIDEAGTLYLSRFRIVGAMMGRHPWFPITVYLHKFHRPDEDRDLHNHPWPWAVSLVLCGGYRELRPAPRSTIPRFTERWLRCGSLNLILGNTFHRVAELRGETWTLFVVGRKVQAWGYDVPGRGFVPWREHDAERAQRRLGLHVLTRLVPLPGDTLKMSPSRIRYFCARCGWSSSAEAPLDSYCGPQCPDCLAFVEVVPPNWLRVLLLVAAVLAGLAVGLALLSLNGCGPAFTSTSEPLELAAGAGGHTQKLPEAGAGGDIRTAAGGGGSGASPVTAGAGGAPPDVVHACERATWQASAFGWSQTDDAGGMVVGGPPSSAVDGDPVSIWSSGAYESPGQWFAVDLGAAQTLSAIKLQSAGPLPAVTLELDGVAESVAATSSPGALELRFAPKRARALRLVLEQAAPVWWTLNDVSAVCQ